MPSVRVPHAVLALLLSAPPALAQTEPFRVVNRTQLAATALHAVPSGQQAWGANLLNQGPLRPGAYFALRPPERAGCRFDLRLVLENGQEVLRREADICAERTVEMAPGPAAPPTPAAPMPQVGGGDRLLPEIHRAPR
ncbi:hypothetical protein [Neoroseomonas soli]|uniref:Uncharacterized protein n=1 Tax=Neoroseomonas soli TaxID=1081025 RepID=A0A9X9X413_9PROT|nr:hypothetical protein [Neoroseomonas soli]MBR0674142.1 hypothetical protein [Neoroseomonas soli]